MAQAKDNNDAAPGVGLANGTKLGKYEIVGRLGMGGQSIVYKGYDTLLERHVAIKQISTHLAGDPRFLDRFRREAQILARLGGEHANIVSVYDLIQEPTGLFIVMEFVDGHTLGTILDHQRYAMPVQPALEIIWHIATGLKVAHAQGIVHRDIKPANIIVNRQYRAKITDFGVAAQTGGQESMTLGTTKYMAPELFEGGPVDARTDVYSLGFIAYEMLTGRDFFNNVFHDVVRDPHSENLRWMKWHANPEMTVPKLAEVNVNVPPVLSDIVARMMAKDPAQRYATIVEVMTDLQKAFSKKKGHHRPQAGSAAEITGGEGGEVGLISDKEGPLALPAEGVEESEEAPTAKIPKTPMNPRKKMILVASAAGAAILLGAVLGVSLLTSSSSRQTEARAAYKVAKEDLYDKAKYAEALRGFEQIVTQPRFKNLNEQKNAAARLLMCQAHLVMMNGEWEQASKLIDDPRVKEIIDGKELQSFRGELTVRRDVVDRLKRANQSIQAKNFDAAEAELGKLGTALPPDLKVQAEAAHELLVTSRTRDNFDKLLAAGDAAMTNGDAALNQGNFPLADSQYKTAEQRYLEAKRVLGNDEVGQRLKKHAETQQFAGLLLKADAAETEGKIKDQADALAQADAIRPSDDRKTKINWLRAEDAFQQASAAKAAGDSAEARRKILEAQKLLPDDPRFADFLKELSTDQERTKFVRQGDSLMRESKFAEAVDQFEQAMSIRPAPDVEGKLGEAKFQKFKAAGDAARKAQQWDEAKKQYEQARQLKADDKNANDLVDGLLAAVDQEHKFYDVMAGGEEQLKSKHYLEAVKAFTEAESMSKGLAVPSDLATGRKKAAQYESELTKGKSAMDRKEYAAAKGYLNLARNFMNTEEVRNLISQAEAALATPAP